MKMVCNFSAGENSIPVCCGFPQSLAEDGTPRETSDGIAGNGG